MVPLPPWHHPPAAANLYRGSTRVRPRARKLWAALFPFPGGRVGARAGGSARSGACRAAPAHGRRCAGIAGNWSRMLRVRDGPSSALFTTAGLQRDRAAQRRHALACRVGRDRLEAHPRGAHRADALDERRTVLRGRDRRAIRGLHAGEAAPRAGRDAVALPAGHRDERARGLVAVDRRRVEIEVERDERRPRRRGTTRAARRGRRATGRGGGRRRPPARAPRPRRSARARASDPGRPTIRPVSWSRTMSSSRQPACSHAVSIAMNASCSAPGRVRPSRSR